MKQLNIIDIHSRVLEIAKEFDRICTKHDIPYYMLGGTMLGAIRHKGFIPWDDDMDFGVPIEYFIKLENLLNRELPPSYRCCTYKDHPGVLHNYMKIEDRSTCIDDKAIDLPIEQKLGLNIDIFPLVKCQLDDTELKKLKRKKELLGKAYLHSVSHPNSKLRAMVKTILRILTGGSPSKLQRDIERILQEIKEGDYRGNLLGRWGVKEIIPIVWYGNGERYPFEDTSFVGIKEYDQYLKRLYGDYMSLPPVGQQVAHVENAYLRD